MKAQNLFLVLLIVGSTYCVSETMMAQLREVHVYLADALKPVFNKTEPVDLKEIVNFVSKNEFMHDILRRFTSNKKKSLYEMAGNFADGILSTVSDKLSENEKIASIAYTNNPVYRSSWDAYEKDFPEPKCFSADYGYVLLNTTKQIHRQDFDPMRFYYGTLQLLDSIEGETKFKKERLEVDLAFNLDGFEKLHNWPNGSQNEFGRDKECRIPRMFEGG